MKVIVQGVSIELTKEQVEHFENEKAKQLKECSTFTKTLKHFGFNKINTKSWPNPNENAYSHYQYGWYAEIQDYGTYKACFLTGKGLKSIEGFPGGYVHDSPESVAAAITKALDEMEEVK
ncbi:hypothetical protein HP439_13015 [Sphingobacterium shayense]|uniref:hypothetical protein n=1 Tax=Sphingobacterium shayense TaxID=626343 RepID=UPI001555A82B|nr:hypothetical protein [Sphingobacterium shayense]NQD71643.1 hypothetical protein [Sphingobacterium shayense]